MAEIIKGRSIVSDDWTLLRLSRLYWRQSLLLIVTLLVGAEVTSLVTDAQGRSVTEVVVTRAGKEERFALAEAEWGKLPN